METWTYFNRPTNMAFHDLTTTRKPHPNLRSLLGLSLKFIPTPRRNVPITKYAQDTFPRFERQLRLKAFFANKKHGKAFDHLEDFQDDYTEDKKDVWGYDQRLYIPTQWEPPEYAKFPPQCQFRLDRFRQNVS